MSPGTDARDVIAAMAARPDPTPAPALRCAVLGWTGHNWQVIFANGDETAARQAAAEWLAENPDSECQLMIAQDRAKLVTKVEWK